MLIGKHRVSGDARVCVEDGRVTNIFLLGNPGLEYVVGLLPGPLMSGSHFGILSGDVCQTSKARQTNRNILTLAKLSVFSKRRIRSLLCRRLKVISSELLRIMKLVWSCCAGFGGPPVFRTFVASQSR